MEKVKFIQTMRWFGPNDKVPLSFIKQSGCKGVVTALHHIPIGEIWKISEIKKRKSEIEKAGLTWEVVESLPVHESIKMKDDFAEEYIANYISSLQNLSVCGIKIITYNFMPLFDWLRTDLNYCMEDGSKALFFDPIALAAFDICVLKRPKVEVDYKDKEIKKAKEYYFNLSSKEVIKLTQTVLQGLPGSKIAFEKEGVLKMLKKYEGISDVELRANLKDFLQRICPIAQNLNLKMAIHPDDPPFSVFGLPRIVNCKEDLKFILEAAPQNSNGLCFCTGSLGVSIKNDIVDIANSFKDRIHFVHLRNVQITKDDQFYESDHLEGSVKMVEVVKTLSKIMNELGKSIPMRPDHGHQFNIDANIDSYPGYSAVGRLRGLAEIRGLEHGILYN